MFYKHLLVIMTVVTILAMFFFIFCVMNLAGAEQESIIPALTYNSANYNSTQDDSIQVTIAWLTMPKRFGGRTGSVTMAIQDYREHGGVPNVTFR